MQGKNYGAIQKEYISIGSENYDLETGGSNITSD